MSKMWTFLALVFFCILNFGYQFYTANLHAHTAYSDGVGTPEEAFAHAQNYVDVQAITDHAEYFAQKIGDHDKLTLTKNVAFDFNEPGRFVALWGFEWTGGVGHINVYCTDEWIDRTRSLAELYEWIVEKKALAQFNHPIATFGTFYEFEYDPKADEFINLIEVGNGSWRGRIISDEMLSNYILALKKGWHLGATAGQDNHRGEWGSANDARTFILAERLDLKSILEALRERRTYASEDRTAKLWFSCDQQPMGSIVKSIGRNVLKIRYEDDEPLEKLYLISEDGTITEWDVNEQNFETEFEVVPNDVNEWFFVYAVQSDGDKIVSSPIWIRALEIYPVNTRVLTSVGSISLAFDLVNFSDEATQVEITISVGDQHEVFMSQMGPKSKVSISKSYSDLQGQVEVRIELAGMLGWKTVVQVPAESILLDVSHDNDEKTIVNWLIEASKQMGATIELNKVYFKRMPKQNLVILPLPKKGSFPESRMLNDFEIENLVRHVEAGAKLVLISYDEAIIDESFVRLVQAVDPKLNLVETDEMFVEVEGKKLEEYSSEKLIIRKIRTFNDALKLLEELVR